MKTVIALTFAVFCAIAVQSVSAQQPCPVLCQFGASHRFPHFTQCNRYYECQSGHLFDFACSQIQRFDIETLQCSDAPDARCVLDQDVRALPQPSRGQLY